MREKDLPLDRSRHAIYTKNAKKCVQTLLRRYYDEPTAAQLWEKIQLQYCAFLEDVLPVMCNCDHLAMQKLHATLIREGTCCTGSLCDYCIVGDRNPIAGRYELVKRDNGLWVSVKK